MEDICIYCLVCALVTFHCTHGSQLLIERNIIINKTYEDAYLDFCKQSCFNRDLIPSGHCSTCYCGDYCHLHNDCCPDARPRDNETAENMVFSSCSQTTFPRLVKINRINTYPCLPPFEYCHKYKFEKQIESYKLITSCPKSFHGSLDMIRRCENFNMDNESTIHPVTDMNTHISYRNGYCASCNGVANMKRWEEWVICRDEVPDRYGNSVEELLNNTLSVGCSIRFDPPESEHHRDCDLDAQHIDSCNVTGEWLGEETDLPSRCNRTYQYDNEVSDYRNIFCYFCNKQDIFYPPLHLRYIYDIVGVVNYDLTNLQPVNHSLVDTYQKECRPISCPDGRRFVNGTCKSLFKRFNGNVYKLCMKLDVMAERSKLHQYLVTYKFAYNYLVKIVNIIKTDTIQLSNYSLAMLNMAPCKDGYLNATVAVGLYLTTMHSKNSEDENIRHIQKKVMEIVGSVKTEPYQTLSVKVLAECMEKDLVEQTTDKSCLQYDPSLSTRLYGISDVMLFLYVAKHVIFTKLLMCPQMVVKREEVDIDFENDEITILANNKTLTAVNFKLVDEGYLICVEDYIENGELVETEACRTSGVSRLYGSFFACLIISIIRHQFI